MRYFISAFVELCLQSTTFQGRIIEKFSELIFAPVSWHKFYIKVKNKPIECRSDICLNSKLPALVCYTLCSEKTDIFSQEFLEKFYCYFSLKFKSRKSSYFLKIFLSHLLYWVMLREYLMLTHKYLAKWLWMPVF